MYVCTPDNNVVFIGCGMPKKQAKGLCKWMSNSNIMAARDIWNIPSRLVKGKFLFGFLFEGISFMALLNSEHS